MPAQCGTEPFERNCHTNCRLFNHDPQALPVAHNLPLSVCTPLTQEWTILLGENPQRERNFWRLNGWWSVAGRCLPTVGRFCCLRKTEVIHSSQPARFFFSPQTSPPIFMASHRDEGFQLLSLSLSLSLSSGLALHGNNRTGAPTYFCQRHALGPPRPRHPSRARLRKE